MAFPFLARCREAYGETRIVAVAREWVAPVLANSPLIDEVVIISRSEDRGVKGASETGRRLRSVELKKLYLLSPSWRSAYVGWMSGASQRIGYAGQGRSPLLTDAVPAPAERLHRSQRYLNLLGVQGTPDYLNGQIRLTDEEQAAAQDLLRSMNLSTPLGIFPGSVAQSRRPPTSLWVGVIERALDQLASVLLIGAERDVPLANELVSQFPDGAVRSVCGELSLRESMAVIAQCSGAITADSGLGHIAANLGLPTVSFFGAGDPGVTAPLGRRAEVIFEGVHCSPCRKNVCHNRDEPLLCLTTINPETVWQTYRRLASPEMS